MQVVQEKYATLVPRVEYLSDPVVLTQAWKKAHAYIRRHNWYADALELDCSAVDLHSRIDQWASELERGTYLPNPMWCVPAPKNGQWIFSGLGWHPRDKDPVLRPLAHLGIREQTVSTAVMLCLANCIESAQGDPSTPVLDAAKKGVFSYGNRLYCKWTEGGRAYFSWGNANVYSRYFQDYQSFVERPKAIAHRVMSRFGGGVLTFIVKLDVRAFYDGIDKKQLIEVLRGQYRSFAGSSGVRKAGEKFWTLAKRSLDFSWRQADLGLKSLFKGGVMPTGLPQGLVASGFFANAYMLSFDKAIGQAAAEETFIDELDGIQVHDYCRYVDDIRIVVSAQRESPDLTDRVQSWVQEYLDDHVGGLQLNSEKTDVELFGGLGTKSDVASKMKALQNELSGPFDLMALQQVETGLTGLLALAELALQSESTHEHASSFPELAAMAKPKIDVRDDTLTRFSAYRLRKALRLRRSMTDPSEPVGETTAGDMLVHDFEMTARRLISAWVSNPSLVQVLRYGLDVFPSESLLRPVTKGLLSKLSDGVEEYERRVAFYVLAELFKAGAVETGMGTRLEEPQRIGDLREYRSHLADVAYEVIEMSGVPWYVNQQAALFLACCGRRADVSLNEEELNRHRALHDYLRGASRRSSLEPMDRFTVAMLGHRLKASDRAFSGWFRSFAGGVPSKDVQRALGALLHLDVDLFERVIKGHRSSPYLHRDALGKSLLSIYDIRTSHKRGWKPANNDWVSLAAVIESQPQVFQQENALLQLAVALAEIDGLGASPQGLLNPWGIEIMCNDWALLNDPRSECLEVRVLKKSHYRSPIFAAPPWCPEDSLWMYALGRILRAAAIGKADFTSHGTSSPTDDERYTGIRSTWETRRIGLHNSAKALSGTRAAIPPWFSNLLSVLLCWPGISINGPDSEFSFSTLKDFLALVRERMAHQSAIFGRSSGLPIYRFPVDWDVASNGSLRIAVVQGLLPSGKDFGDSVQRLSDKTFRERHRNHTAALLNLTHRKLLARQAVLDGKSKARVDLVVFPEYAIHVADQDLMRAFSDATGAMLFYGLAGATDEVLGAPINTARWLVPQKHQGRRSWVEVDQGKGNLTEEEKALGVAPWRPYQVVIELVGSKSERYRISGAICYDATDIALAADLKDESHMFVVSAMNKDVKTFDSMVSALRYHMYQHVIIANSGQYGGSTAQAPYSEEHERMIAHVHGGKQIYICVFDVDT
jgi:Reverse transcriptase (RNA-dependent DNA polymerase)